MAISYFLQVQICWLLFYAAYYVLLSRETFFTLNRFWLLASLVAGLLLPILAPLLEVTPTEPMVLILEPIVISAAALNQNLHNTEGGYFAEILSYLYGLGIVFFLSKLIIGLFKIYQIFKHAQIEKQTDYTLVLSDKPIVPFSFFTFIFINPKRIDARDFQQIIQHERAHVAQKHSLDIVFLELVAVVFWWCPVVYFFKKSLRNVHEYAADAAVLRHTTTPQYGRLLLRQHQSGMSWPLANQFFSQLKKRILMMTRSQSKRWMLAKYALAAPIFLLLVLLLASPKTQVLAETKRLTAVATQTVENLENQVVEAIKNADSQQFTAETNSPVEAILNDAPPQYRDTLIRPLKEIESINVSDIQRMDILHLDDEQTLITVNFKNGKVEQFKGKKSEAKILFMKDKIVEERKELKEVPIPLSDSPHNPAIQNPSNPAAKIEERPIDENTVFTIVEQQPEYPEGQAALFRWLGDNIKYPETARLARAEGTVYIGFVVETDGAITNVQIKRDVPVIIRDTIALIEANGLQGNKIIERKDYSLGREAERVIKAMPNWRPGKQKGKPVRVAYTLPIKFKLE
jgi:beta-lactamase regulating signal transducer with metallopeptidase domain